HTGRGPMVERLLERPLDDLLGGVDVAHDPKHGRDHARVLQTEGLGDAGVNLGARRLPVVDRSHEQRCYSIRLATSAPPTRSSSPNRLWPCRRASISALGEGGAALSELMSST